MNIQDELKKDRLAIDIKTPHVFIRQDLYQELLDTSMFPHALRVIRVAKWKKLLLKIFLIFNHDKYERMVLVEQFKYYLNRLIEYINEERIHVLGMSSSSVVSTLHFTITDADARPLYVGVYREGAADFYIRQWIGSSD